MRLLLDSLWRSVAYCLHPQVIALSLLPLALMAIVALALGHFYWEVTVDWTRRTLDAWPLLSHLWTWMGGIVGRDIRRIIAPLIVVLAVTPLIVVFALGAVTSLMTPALTRMVAERRFPELERKKGGSFFSSALRSIGLTVLALLALFASMPLWLIPPLALILPPLIWGWLIYRVMSFDALSEFSTPEERRAILEAHQLPLLSIGVLCGYLGAAPSIAWASGLLFAAAFFVLIPIAIWIYTLVFAFSALWFAHYGLDALATLRQQEIAAAAAATGIEMTAGASPPPPATSP
jgi:hypothetical protein